MLQHLRSCLTVGIQLTAMNPIYLPIFSLALRGDFVLFLNLRRSSKKTG